MINSYTDLITVSIDLCDSILQLDGGEPSAFFYVLLVNRTSVTNVKNPDQKLIVFDFVNYSICANSGPVSILFAN